MAGKAAHMHFVDDCLRGGPVERHVAFPIVRTRIDHHTLHGRRAIVAFLPSSFATVILRHNGTASIGIEEDFGRIEAQAARRIIGSINSIAIDLPCSHTLNEYMPVVICAIGCAIDADHARGSRIIDVIKEKKLHCRCMLRVDAKVCPARTKCRSDRSTPTCGDFLCHG